jgi:signal transduction histidine kinase/ActR/RegA family two-component response regulator
VTATPIRRSLMKMVLLTTSTVLVLALSAFVLYDFITFRQIATRHLSTVGQVIATNSSAALAFHNKEDADSVLSALAAEPSVEAAALYDADGALFATYPLALVAKDLPAVAGPAGYSIVSGHVVGRQVVSEGTRPMGTLVLSSNLSELYARLGVYAAVSAVIFVIAGLIAYAISRKLQHQVTRPILALAETARAVSDRRDYSVRAVPSSGHELGLLTDAFNHMLTRIQQQHDSLQAHLARMHLLQHITQAIGERQDLDSIFQVVLQSLEQNLSIDFGFMALYDQTTEMITVSKVGGASQQLAIQLGMSERAPIRIDQNGLSRSVKGELVYEPDILAVKFPFPQKLASAGLRSLVIAPLSVEHRVFGVLVAARSQVNAFSSPDNEFLKHLCEQVALATQQTQLYGALQQAYDDLRQSQHTVMQQERLRALGQMASGIAHDINNAISPVALYTESLLEREPDLSARARGYLTTIQRAIEDVASTVSRMREFYRPRESQLLLARLSANTLVEQVVDLTRPRWSAVPQQRGISIDLKMILAPGSTEIMGADGEIRDALTNLIFNAVDAMPEGGTITVRTTVVEAPTRQVRIEVSDTGVGMDEETRRRCLEPFFTTKGERGTGLGLAMVYGMVQRHSAELEVISEVGYGTTIRLIFPDYAPQTDATVRVDVLPMMDRRLRILLVDDDPLLIKSLQDTLEADGHIVTAAHGGQQGIDTFNAAHGTTNRFAVVVTDLGMPHVDGRKVAASIKSISSSTPVIMLTGWGQRLVAENDIPPHVNRVLSKPPKLMELRATLAELTSEVG